MIAFTLPHPTPTANTWQRMHYRKRSAYQRALSWEIHILTRGTRPNAPICPARVTITRYSRGVLPDMDGLIGGCKALLDVLQPASKRHPAGLGIIADDNAAALTTLYRAERANGNPRTEVLIEPHPAQNALNTLKTG